LRDAVTKSIQAAILGVQRAECGQLIVRALHRLGGRSGEEVQITEVVARA
jgi:hypothetical protein